MHLRLLPIIVTLLAATPLVYAQSRNHLRYQWQDAQGLTHYSDSLNAEAMKLGYSVINDQGIVVSRVARPLTPEERAAADKLAQQQAEQQRAARRLATAEAQMLNAYPDEASYRTFQQQQLGALDTQIRATQTSLRSQEKSLADLLGRAAEIERAKETVPKFLTDDIADQRAVVTGQRNTLAQQQASRGALVKKQEAALLRYRELKAEQDRVTQ